MNSIFFNFKFWCSFLSHHTLIITVLVPYVIYFKLFPVSKLLDKDVLDVQLAIRFSKKEDKSELCNANYR